MTIRVGLIGAGGIGVLRAAALGRSSDCSLAAVADVDLSRARALAQPAGAGVFDSHRALFDAGGLDAVIVSAPPQLHEPITCDALEAGLHVLCEKPLSNSVPSARRMVERARSLGRVLATGFNHRYFPAIRLVKSALESGDLGDLDHVRAFAGHVGLSELAGAPWLTDPEVMGGGTLMDNGIHLLDLTRHVLGEVRDVSGVVGERVWRIRGAEDNGFALLRSMEGPVASLHSSWSEWRGYRFWVAAYGTRGTAWGYYAPMLGMLATIDRESGRSRRRYQLFPRVNLLERLKGWQHNVVGTFVEELRDFRGLIEGRPGLIAEGFDGFRAVEMAHAIYRSSAESRSVELCSAF